jgi:hypothetical protein
MATSPADHLGLSHPTEEHDHATTSKDVRAGGRAIARLSGSAQAQFLVIGDDNKLLHFDDAGKPVFTEPGKDEVVIVDIKNRESPTITATLPLMNSVIGPPTLASAESSGDVTSFAWVMPSYSNNAIAPRAVRSREWLHL